MTMVYHFQISSMIGIEVELDVDVVAVEAVSNVVCRLLSVKRRRNRLLNSFCSFDRKILLSR